MMAASLKPIDNTYLRDVIRLAPGDRLHRLIARLADTYIDDLSDESIVELEQLADTFRITHADGKRFPKITPPPPPED
jgi:hypothetical protein